MSEKRDRTTRLKRQPYSPANSSEYLSVKLEYFAIRPRTLSNSCVVDPVVDKSRRQMEMTTKARIYFHRNTAALTDHHLWSDSRNFLVPVEQGWRRGLRRIAHDFQQTPMRK